MKTLFSFLLILCAQFSMAATIPADGWISAQGKILAKVSFENDLGVSLENFEYEVEGKSYLIFMTRDRATLDKICQALNYRRATGFHFLQDETAEPVYANNGIGWHISSPAGAISMSQIQDDQYPFISLVNKKYGDPSVPWFLNLDYLNCAK